ncbi:MAG: type II toxin-antitoxin system Phd/YefM family antitoxin [Gammaproteobacteria bacterium]
MSKFKAKAAQMLAEMKAAEHEIVLTQNGAATAVVQDYDSYQRLQDALVMMRLMAQGEADVRDGRATRQDRVFSDLKKRLMRGDA